MGATPVTSRPNARPRSAASAVLIDVSSAIPLLCYENRFGRKKTSAQRGRFANSMSEIEGNTAGLSPSTVKTLERLYRRKVPLGVIATPELMKTLCEASREASRQVGVLVHR